jgi:predicted NBD/HSP70 family sugar kinase
MPRDESGSLGSLRELNRDRVVDTLHALGVASRAEIARRTGLSRSTISSIVTDLRRSGVVVDYHGSSPTAPSGSGRPPSLITLDRSAGAAVGIDFGKRHLLVAVSDLSHEILAEATREMKGDYSAEEGIRAAGQLVGKVLEKAGVDPSRVLGVGMGVPGPIHRPTGTVGSSSILPGWVGIPAAEEMARRLSLPVHVENDANLGALSEFVWGAGRGSSSLAYLKLATGIGAGLVIDGQLFSGAGGTAGEIGHTTIDETGDICRCGNRGCLETMASAPAIAGLVGRSLDQELEPEEVLARAAAGDPVASRALADAGRHVGVAVANLCNLVNPERIVVGGSMGSAGELLLEPLRDSVRLRAIATAAEDVEIVPAELGERAEVLGAMALVLHETEGAALATRALARAS